MIVIDGSLGEGGGQVLRTSLALSLVTGRAFRIEGIRAGRRNPGLMRQHLTAVAAAAEIGSAEVSGVEVGSAALEFRPRGVTPGSYRFAVGTAGSATLVFQTILPALMVADEESTLVLEGGTHNAWAPPFDFLKQAFLPLVGRMGPQVQATLHRPGFYPAGGGRFTAVVSPANPLVPLDLTTGGDVRRTSARALVARLPAKIARRELQVVSQRLSWSEQALQVEEIEDSAGPGNVLLCEVAREHVTEVFTGFGERGVRAETVAKNAADQVRRYLAAAIPVGPHLADQLLVPLAIAGGGRFRTVEPTRHTTTNIEVIKSFVPVRITTTRLDRDVFDIEIQRGMS